MKKERVLLASLTLVCSACADMSQMQSGDREERIYRTGSNIPAKDYGPTSQAKTGDASSVQLPPNIRRPIGSSGI